MRKILQYASKKELMEIYEIGICSDYFINLLKNALSV